VHGKTKKETNLIVKDIENEVKYYTDDTIKWESKHK